MIEKIKYWFKFIILYKNWNDLILDRILKRNSNKIVLRNGLEITGSDKTPLSVVTDEIFLFNRYTPKHLKINNGDIIVDIGSHIGSFSFFAANINNTKVISYEPDPDTYNLLLKNIEINKIKNIAAHNKAVTNKNSKTTLYKNEADGGNSIYKSKTSTRKVITKSTTIKNIFVENKINIINFLKIDCEGSEGLIFKYINKNTLKKIDKISMEYHNNVSILKHAKINKILNDNRFNTKIIEFDKNFGYIHAWK